MNPDDLPPDAEHRAQALANTGCDLIVLGDDLGLDAAIGIAGNLSRSFPEVEIVLIAPGVPTTLAAAMAAGIRSVIDPSTPADQLREEVARIGVTTCLRRTRLHATMQTADAEAPSTGRIITVMAAKGGVGKTTIAVNIAVELARHHPHRVVLVDLDLMAGDVDLLLDLAPKATLASVAIEGVDIDTAGVKLALSSHSSGLLVLPAPETLIEADAIDPNMVHRVLNLLRHAFDFIVVDTAPGAAGVFVEAAELADDLLAVSSPDLGGLRSLRRNLDALDALELTAANRHLVLNRSDYRTGLTADDIEGAIELPIIQAIPETREIPMAANQGLPYVVTNPKAPAVHALRSLTNRLDPSQAAAKTEVNGAGARRTARAFDAR